MFAKVPVINGIPEVGKTLIIQGVNISPTEAYIKFKGDLKEGWTEITQEEFEVLCPPIELNPIVTLDSIVTQLQVDNAQLKADNLILMDAIATMYEEILILTTPV